MDPTILPVQAEVFTSVLKAMGDAAKDPEVVQEISEAVKQVDQGKTILDPEVGFSLHKNTGIM
jgi:hypothetical protein